MNKLLIFSALVLLYSCSNVEDKGNINDCISILKSAESFEVDDVSLPCGLRFGMTHEEMDLCLAKQSQNPQSRLKKVGNFYHYMIEANDKQYECMILGMAFGKDKPINEYAFIFDNSELHFMVTRTNYSKI